VPIHVGRRYIGQEAGKKLKLRFKLYRGGREPRNNLQDAGEDSAYSCVEESFRAVCPLGGHRGEKEVESTAGMILVDEGKSQAKKGTFKKGMSGSLSSHACGTAEIGGGRSGIGASGSEA